VFDGVPDVALSLLVTLELTRMYYIKLQEYEASVLRNLKDLDG
jgi:hypothetical protein